MENQQTLTNEATSWISGSPTPLSSNKGTTHRFCRVVGCNVDLEALNRPYCRKRRVCVEHMKADAVMCQGCGDQLWRFCQQCGKLEPLSSFEGNKRSCRSSLAKRRSREDGRVNDVSMGRKFPKRSKQQQQLQQQEEEDSQRPVNVVEHLQSEADLDMGSTVDLDSLCGPLEVPCTGTLPAVSAAAAQYNSSSSLTGADTAWVGSYCQEEQQQNPVSSMATALNSQRQQQKHQHRHPLLPQGTLVSAVQDSQAPIAATIANAAAVTEVVFDATHWTNCTNASPSPTDNVMLESLLQAELEACLVAGKTRHQLGSAGIDIEQVIEDELLAVLNEMTPGAAVMHPAAANSTQTCRQQQQLSAVAAAGPPLCQRDRAAAQSARIKKLQVQLTEVQEMLTRLQLLRSQQIWNEY